MSRRLAAAAFFTGLWVGAVAPAYAVLRVVWWLKGREDDGDRFDIFGSDG